MDQKLFSKSLVRKIIDENGIHSRSHLTENSRSVANGHNTL